MEGIERRSFLAGVAALSGGALLTAAGCTPQKSGGSGSAAASGSASASASGGADSKKAAFEAASQPIPPLDAPSKWDEEHEIVVVGSGAGGVFCALRLARAGYKVLILERNAEMGGNTKYGANFFANWGGHRQANEAHWALPSFPYEPQKVVEALVAEQNFTGDIELQYELVEQGPKCIDWMCDTLGWTWHGTSPAPSANGQLLMWDCPVDWANPETWNPATHYIKMTDRFPIYEKALTEAGVEIRLNSEVLGFVQDDKKKVVGVKVKGKEKDYFVKAERALCLTAGGFEVNRALMKKYCPRATAGLANIATPPYGTGEIFRMGLGVGADVSGFDSTGAFENGIWWKDYDEYDTEMDCHVHGMDGNTVVRQPWMRINKLGQRVPYYSTRGTSYPWQPRVELPQGMYVDPAGLCDQANMEMTQPDGKTYVVFDSKYYKCCDEDYFGEMICRMVGHDNRPGETDEQHWSKKFERCVADGGIFKADTIEELEEKLGLRKGVLTSNVEKWNEACDKGEDYALAFKYPKEWLLKINEPPYYGAIVGGNPFGSKCGLMINKDMQVLNTEGNVIDGLYAGWHTAGGSAGNSNLAGRPQTGIFADGALAYIGGYMIAGSIMKEDGKQDK